MAIVIALLGSILGLVAAIIAFFALEAGFLLALAIWSGTGMGCTLLALTLAILPRRATYSATKTA